tara:strand:+ start:374 stop:772 length:399 start_codon:yes stop_codon:yes gene_type:complete
MKKNNKKSNESDLGKHIDVLHNNITKLMNGLEKIIAKLDLADDVWDEHIDPKLSDEDDLNQSLNEQELFIENCIRLKQILITTMYAVNNPEIMAKIQEVTIKEAMKHEIKNNNPPDDVVNNFLDYINMTKSY